MYCFFISVSFSKHRRSATVQTSLTDSVAVLQGQYNMVFGDPGQGGDVLDNFDFDSFLHDDAGFDFDPTSLAFPNGDGVEAGAEGA